MLGERVKNALNEKGLTTTEVANFIGISEGNLYKLFKKDSFDIAYLLKIATLTEYSINHFLENDNFKTEYSQKSESKKPVRTTDRPMQKSDYVNELSTLRVTNEVLLRNNESLLKDKERLWEMVDDYRKKIESNENPQVEIYKLYNPIVSERQA